MSTLFLNRRTLTQKEMEDIVGGVQQPEQQSTIINLTNDTYTEGGPCGNTGSCSYGTCATSCDGGCYGLPTGKIMQETITVQLPKVR